MRHSFTVPGNPIPQGSMKGFVVNGRAILTSAAKGLKPWRELIAHQAAVYIAECKDGDPSCLVSFLPRGEAVEIAIRFTFVRPQSHLKKSGGLTKSAPLFKTSHPDIDKLARAVLDALTGVFYEDDSQVVLLVVQKDYADPGCGPGVEISIDRYDSTRQRLCQSRPV